MSQSRKNTPAVLRQAAFDPRLSAYYVIQGTAMMVLLVVTIPLAPIYFLVGSLLVGRYIERLSCTLTERTLEIRKGWLFRIESTIPLDKITDLQLYQGPLMRAFGLQGFRVETAGHSAGPGRSLVNLVGIVDTPGFRQAVLDQRDALAQPLGQAGGAGQAGAAAPATPAGTLQAVDVLADIRASLHRIERLLEHRKDI